MRVSGRLGSLLLVVALGLGACAEHGPTPPTGDGTIAIAVVGLPAGAQPTITVTGNGTTQNVVRAGEVAVATGVYTVTAAPVVVAGATWYPNAQTQSGEITYGQRWRVQLRYGRLPVSGTYVASLDLFDSAMVAYMSARNIGAGTLAISRQGQAVYQRGFGWRDSARTEMLPPNAMMRLASNTKPVTSAAIRRLVSLGLLTLETKAFPLLELTPAGPVADARINDITVRHLLEHTAGWNRQIAGDVMFRSRDISRALGITTPPTEAQIASFVMTQSLQHAPGSTSSYSNLGYLVLGLVVEKITGQPFDAYVRQNLFTGSAAGEVIVGRSLRSDRDAREPFYSDPFKGCSVFVIDPCVLVPWPDGGWYLESFDACGGLVASAPAMATFLESYWINGQPRAAGTSGSFTFYGSLDGTFTMTRQRADGVNIVALFNQRTDPSGLSYEEIQLILDGVADRVVATGSLSCCS
jgi:CubicO group peptidase (beta-lactamase class C family)